MPGWKAHLWFGIFGVFPLILVFSVLLLLYPTSRIYLAPQVPLFSTMGLLLSISLSLSIIFGSLLPDLDGGGKITVYIPPFFGGYALFLFYVSQYFHKCGILHLEINGVLTPLIIFTVATLLSYGLLFLPKKHRGRLHHPMTAIVFGGLWALGHSLFWCLNGYSALLLFVVASYGYSLHLILDWLVDLKGRIF